jgi:hypothetical protein
MGQKVVKQEQKIDIMPNNVFVTKVLYIIV